LCRSLQSQAVIAMEMQNEAKLPSTLSLSISHLLEEHSRLLVEVWQLAMRVAHHGRHNHDEAGIIS